jgi:hypothetical protein
LRSSMGWECHLRCAFGSITLIVRYRLYEIDLIINRTLVYSSLTATLVALYFGGIVVLQRVDKPPGSFVAG